MKTAENEIRVLVDLCGTPVLRHYPIRTKNGDLMTNRLEHILDGKIGRTRGMDDAEKFDIEVLGVIWLRPYTILRELREDCIKKQSEILRRDGHSLLTDDATCIIPEDAPDEYISKLVRHELKLRRALKRELDFLNMKI
jgi:hypothetical protein